jgi:hypothetical protein
MTMLAIANPIHHRLASGTIPNTGTTPGGGASAGPFRKCSLWAGVRPSKMLPMVQKRLEIIALKVVGTAYYIIHPSRDYLCVATTQI